MQHRRIIKRGPIVLATEENGAIDPTSHSTQGLFLADTRFLSHFCATLNGEDLVLMGSSEEVLFEASFIFTNPQLGDIPARGLGIMQHNIIGERAVSISFDILNWSLQPVEFDLQVQIGADFFDSFEARGVKRVKRGEILPPRSESGKLELSYLGLDQITRKTEIAISQPYRQGDGDMLHFDVNLDPDGQFEVSFDITMVEHAPEGVSLQPEPSVTRNPKPPWFDQCTRVRTGNEDVDQIIRRSIDDLEVLMTRWEDAWMPAAGLPRFAVPFGRDSLYTGLFTLTWNPQIARNVLRFLADKQGKEENPWNYEQPGKIMHEMHTGELARLREVPFGLFYGSVDSTVLFLVLGAEYIRWTGDMRLYHELKGNFEAAWKWVDTYGNIDGTGYVQYQAHTPPKLSSAALTVGLFNQGWKDSANSVMYGDGTLVTRHPISLSEVQGDLYRALHLWANLYREMPEKEEMRDQAAALDTRAANLKEQFNREFWMPEKSYYAMALDGDHRQVDSITSNPLECLWARLIADENVEAFVETAFSPSLFTSWGFRTMANTEKAYNPFSYHDGSIWPFENTIVAAGLKKYGMAYETQRVFDALVDASDYFEYRRWPEVYAGVGADTGGVLAVQPDASRPQAWSAASIFLLMQTILGVATKPFSCRVDVTPVLPSQLDEVVIENMKVNGGTLSFRVVREGNGVLMEITDNPDGLDIVVRPAARERSHLTGKNAPAVSG